MKKNLLNVHLELLKKAKEIDENMNLAFKHGDYENYEHYKQELFFISGSLLYGYELLIEHVKNAKKD